MIHFLIIIINDLSNNLNIIIIKIIIVDECSREEMNAHLFERLHADFPGDVGCFGIYFFNYVTLQRGEAIYLSPDEPHAYLSGGKVLNFIRSFYY